MTSKNSSYNSSSIGASGITGSARLGISLLPLSPNTKKRSLAQVSSFASPPLSIPLSPSSSASRSAKAAKAAVHPREYAESTFRENGAKDLEAIVDDCVARMKPPTAEMLAAYAGDIVSAVRGNDLARARLRFHEGKFGHGVNACNRFGESILHMACRRGHIDMVRFLIEDVGLSVSEIRDDYDRTPLHDAFWTSKASYDVVDYLLRQPYVADLLLCKDKRGFTPLDYTRAEDRRQWLAFLRERKALLRPTMEAAAAAGESDDDDDQSTDSSNPSMYDEIKIIDYLPSSFTSNDDEPSPKKQRFSLSFPL